jgi:hypothetical protein
VGVPYSIADGSGVTVASGTTDTNGQIGGSLTPGTYTLSTPGSTTTVDVPVTPSSSLVSTAPNAAGGTLSSIAAPVTVAPSAATSPGGVARIALIPNDSVANHQDRTAILTFHPEREYIEDATLKAHRHLDVTDSTVIDRHIQIHTKKADGTDLTSRLEIQYKTDDAYILVTSAHLELNTNAYVSARNAGDPIVFKSPRGDPYAGGTYPLAQSVLFSIEASGVLSIPQAGVYSTTATAGGVHTVPATAREYLVFRDAAGALKKIAVFDA